MNTAVTTVVNGLSALIAQLGQNRIGTRLVNVGGDVCLAIPARFMDGGADPKRGNTVARQRPVDVPQVTSEQRAYLSSWQAEMEDFDRF